MKSRQTTFPAGQYKGHLICEVPSDYLDWVIGEADIFGDDIKEIAEEEYLFRSKRKQHWKGSNGTYKKKKTNKSKSLGWS